MHYRHKLFTKLKYKVEESSLSHLMSGAWIQEELSRLQDNARRRCRVWDKAVVMVLMKDDLLDDGGILNGWYDFQSNFISVEYCGN